MDRCHTYQGVHIPGCMGCAASDHYNCTCPPKATHDASLAQRINELEQRIAALEVARA